MKNTKLAVIGGGVIGRTHAVAIKECTRTSLAAIVDPFASGEALAREMSVPHYQSYEALIDQGIDGAIIATPNALHVPQAIALIEAGVPVLVEKPLGDTAHECERLVSVAKESGLAGLVGHHRRYNPILQAARAAIDSDAFGTLVSGSISAVLKKSDSYFEAEWRREAGSGGPILINLIHEIDLVRFLFGEIVEVFAMTSDKQRGFSVEDTASVVLRLADGGLITVALTDAAVGPWSWDMTAGENRARFPVMPAVSHVFAGTKAGMSLPDLAFWTFDGKPEWTVPQVNRPLTISQSDCYVEQVRHFSAVIAGEETACITLADGAANIAVIEAIKRSQIINAPVAL
jgi:predicted dehydrogenase